jgi:hypothetical protein
LDPILSPSSQVQASLLNSLPSLRSSLMGMGMGIGMDMPRLDLMRSEPIIFSHHEAKSPDATSLTFSSDVGTPSSSKLPKGSPRLHRRASSEIPVSSFPTPATYGLITPNVSLVIHLWFLF